MEKEGECGDGRADSAWCVQGGGWDLFAGGRKQNPLSEGTVLLLFHCMMVEKGSPGGFLSALSNKTVLSKAFIVLNVKISIAAHTPKVSEAVADWCPLA